MVPGNAEGCVSAAHRMRWNTNQQHCTDLCFLASPVLTTCVTHRPTWSLGILHYTYDDPKFDFTRVVPVAVTTLLLTILGVASTVNDLSHWPFFVGPAACLALSAGVIPKNVAPLILTGNAGEAVLLASLAFTEWQMFGQLH